MCADSGKCDSGTEPGSVFVVMWDHVEAGVMLHPRHRHALGHATVTRVSEVLLPSLFLLFVILLYVCKEMYLDINMQRKS